MQVFISSVLSALRALLKDPRWLWKVISILFSWKKSQTPRRLPPDLPDDSEGIHLQRRSYSTYRQSLPPRPAGVCCPVPPQSPDYGAPLQSDQPHYRIAAPPHAPVTDPANAERFRQSEKLVRPDTPGTLPTESVSYLHDTDEPTFEARISSPDRPQSQHDPTGYKDKNQANKHNEHYMSLRAKASQEGDKIVKCFQQSHDAYERGEHALANALSEEGRQHERTMEARNDETSAWIFQENNLDSKPGELDLHGLYVREAISYSDNAIEEARQRGDSQIRFIVGKGSHSDGQCAKIKPALGDWMKEHNIPAEVDPQNAGVLIVQLA